MKTDNATEVIAVRREACRLANKFLADIRVGKMKTTEVGRWGGPARGLLPNTPVPFS